MSRRKPVLLATQMDRIRQARGRHPREKEHAKMPPLSLCSLIVCLTPVHTYRPDHFFLGVSL